MLNVPVVEITSTVFIADPCPRDRLLWVVALSFLAGRKSDAAGRVIISSWRSSQRAIYGIVGSEKFAGWYWGGPGHSAFRRAFVDLHGNLSQRQLYPSFLKYIYQFSLYSV